MMFNRKFGIIALILCVVLLVGYFINTGAVSTVLLAIQGAITDGNLIKFSGTNGIGIDTGIPATSVVKSKFDATSAPTVNNDADEGYVVGSRWLDVTNDKSYVCVDNTDAAAIWHLDVVGPGTSTDHGVVRWDSTTGRTVLDSVVTISDTGVIAGGEWQGTVISPVYGGTGVANAVNNTITFTGNFILGLTLTEDTSVTLPASGTLATTAQLHTQNTDTDLDATFEATFVKKADTVNVLSDITSAGADIEDAVTKKHAQNTDTLLSIATALSSDHTYVGVTDSKAVGENVVFGDLLYFDWTQTEWMKAKADAYATARSRRIALETKGDGQACLMLVTGYIRDDSAFEFTTATVFLSIATAGATQSTVPEIAGNQIQVVGTAISADIMEYSPSMDVGEI